MSYKFVFISCTLINLSLSAKAPVLIWGSEREDVKPSLNVVSNKDFSDLIEKELKDSMIVAFLESGLSSEDLSRCQFDSGSCFTKLAQLTPRTYYTNVENPVPALRDAANKKEYIEVNVNGELNTPVNYEVGKVLFVNFEEDRSDVRENVLHDHDLAIFKAYEKLSKLGKIVALYTSVAPITHSRQVRQAARQQGEGKNYTKVFFPESKFLIYFKSVKIVSEPKADLDVTDLTLTETTKKAYDLKFTTDKGEIDLKINFREGYWSLVDFKYNSENIHSGTENITVPEGFSYYCRDTTFVTEKLTKIQWHGLQMQAFSEAQKVESFGDPWHCVGFTSTGIWSGLFVTFMMLGILSYGISWLMDIKTMDRFDDPKGKTITINASD